MTDTVFGALESVIDSLDGRDGDLISFAERERLGPLLYYELERRGFPKTVSATDRESLRRAYYASAGHNIELLTALSELSLLLSEQGIRLVALKGADLATNVYPNVAVRPMGDVDVYAAPDDVSRTEKALLELGYHPWCPEMATGLMKRARHARLFVGGPSALSIDLHWSLVGSEEDRRAPATGWLPARTVKTDDAPWMRLTASAHLLYLSAHMKLQHFEDDIPLLWLVDFHLLANQQDIEWKELFEDADRLGWTGALAAAAGDVRERLKLPLPLPLARLAGAPMAGTLRTVDVPRTGPRTTPERIWSELATLSWPARLALAGGIVVPSAEYMKFRYASRWIWPLGYVKRWWTMLREGAGLLFRRRRARGDRTTASHGRRETW